MIPTTREADLNSHHLISSQSSSLILKMSWEFILNCIVEIFDPQFSTKTPYRNQLFLEVAKNTIIFIQTLSLFWYPDITISNWSSYSTFWNFLWYFNYDSICMKLNIYTYCYIGEIVVIFYSLFIVILYCAFKFWEYRLPQMIIYSAKELISFLSSVSFIPSLTILLIVFKYSAFKYSGVQEYYDDDINKFNHGLLGSIICPILIVMLILLAFMNELMTVDMKHSSCMKNLKSRSNSAWDLLWISFSIIQCFLYVFMDKTAVLFYLSIALILGLYVFWCGFRYLHYYNPVENSIQNSKIGSICAVLIIFLLGYIIDNAATMTLLSFFLPPFLIAFITYWTHKKHLKLPGHKRNRLNQFTFEHSMRHVLTDKNCKNIEEIICVFSHCFHNSDFKKNSLFVIWETNFISHIVKDERLARVRLTQFTKTGFSIEGTIQKYRILKKFNGIKSKKILEIDYLEYLTGLDESKRYDEEMCHLLMDLWGEIACKSPEITKLRKLTERVSDLSCKIKVLYSNLADKNKFSEVLDLYGTLLTNIFGEKYEGNLMLKRKRNVKESIGMQGSQKMLGTYSENHGVMLISLARASFGTVSYINEKAAMILKVSQTEVVGGDLTNFIPWPFSVNHNDKLLKFYNTCTETVVNKLSSLYLLDHNRFIIEIYILVRVTAFNDQAYFMASFTPINTTRQALLISESGRIYAHTAQLSSIICSEKINLSDTNISDLPFGVSMKTLKAFEPYIFNLQHREVVLVYITKYQKGVMMHIILLITDHYEKEKWKNRESDEQIEYYTKVSPIREVASGVYERESFDNDKNTQLDTLMPPKTEKAVTINTTMLSSEGPEDDEEESDKGPSQDPASVSSQASSINQIAFKLAEGTSAAITKFQWVLLFAIIAMIGTNIGILIYIIDDVTHADALDTFNHLGQIMFQIGSIADLVRSIDLELRQGKYNLTRDLGYLSQNIATLSDLQGTILNDKSMWSYCKSSEIVTENKIPLWSFDEGEPKLKKYNLYDSVSLFIQWEQNLLEDAIKENNYYHNNIEWLMINSLSFAFSFIEDALTDLVSCEQSRIKDTGTIINGLLMVGIIILAVCLGVLIYFVVSLRIVYEKFWCFIKKSVAINYAHLKQATLDRLISIHGVELEQDNIGFQKPLDLHNFHIKTTLTWKFSARLSFFGVSSLCFYLLTMFYLYTDCEEYMFYRPKLLENINIQRSYLSRIGLYARDINNEINKKHYPKSYSFANSTSEFNHLVSEYQYQCEILRSKGIANLLSKELKTALYESFNTQGELLKQGTFTAAHSIIFDAFNIGGPGGIRSDKEISDFVSNFTILQDALVGIFDMADTSSKDVISSQLNLITYTTVLFSAGLAFLFLFYYLPFIKAQTKFLKKTRILPKMISVQASDKKSEAISYQTNAISVGI
ncbi:unnamed protein product [Blepharisma stoltei]|uniref:TmcB/TmcC TPR repeats domain-containing protein n=1 Tax=Blepharisma stoltei TaxID=1481888 RepID=A0AAU9JSR9_9CILI|nr:unnamed protein product [Blepharisma stoltei]